MNQEEKTYLVEWVYRLRMGTLNLGECIRATDKTLGKASDLAVSAEVALIDLCKQLEGIEVDE